MPLAAHATVSGEYLTLQAAWGDLDQPGQLVRAQLTHEVADLRAAEQLGVEVANKLIAGGAKVVSAH